ncbi:N-acetyltransferase [Pectinatus sottacetonis]|uniref:N-acetyltransferase n=1 Tax=Pectinatus sottacetonis TaxID=1002795 RepID=UPI0018C67182|nr:N-acetyltransferase [Pectinatus sottacetonis]
MEKSIYIEGKYAILDEISPKYFKYVIKWRNDKVLNKFLNQPFDLTLESELEWYKKYVKDDTQGFMIMIDKESNIPFGTIGWTDLDKIHKKCILGRLILGNPLFKGTMAFLESFILIGDYLYKKVDNMYIHVGIRNKKALHINKTMGFIYNISECQYPHELLVNGNKQRELYRTKDMYNKTKKDLEILF